MPSSPSEAVSLSCFLASMNGRRLRIGLAQAAVGQTVPTFLGGRVSGRACDGHARISRTVPRGAGSHAHAPHRPSPTRPQSCEPATKPIPRPGRCCAGTPTRREAAPRTAALGPPSKTAGEECPTLDEWSQSGAVESDSSSDEVVALQRNGANLPVDLREHAVEVGSHPVELVVGHGQEFQGQGAIRTSGVLSDEAVTLQPTCQGRLADGDR